MEFDDSDIKQDEPITVAWLARTRLAWINRQLQSGRTLTRIAKHLAEQHGIPVTVSALAKAYKKAAGKGLRERRKSVKNVQEFPAQNVAGIAKKSDTSTLSHLGSNADLIGGLSTRKGPQGGSSE